MKLVQLPRENGKMQRCPNTMVFKSKLKCFKNFQHQLATKKVQTAMTQIRLLLKKQSDQSLPCLLNYDMLLFSLRFYIPELANRVSAVGLATD